MDSNKVIVKKSLEEFVKEMPEQYVEELVHIETELTQATSLFEGTSFYGGAVSDYLIREGLIDRESPDECKSSITDLGRQVMQEITRREEKRLIGLGKVLMKLDEMAGKEVSDEVKQGFKEWEEEVNSPAPKKPVSNIKLESYEEAGRTIWQYQVSYLDQFVAFGDGYSNIMDASDSAGKVLEEHLESLKEPEPEVPPTPEQWAKYWEDRFTEFVQDLWNAVGDGKPYEYAGQVYRWAKQDHDALGVIWNIFSPSTPYVNEPTTLIKYVQDAHQTAYDLTVRSNQFARFFVKIRHSLTALHDTVSNDWLANGGTQRPFDDLPGLVDQRMEQIQKLISDRDIAKRNALGFEKLNEELRQKHSALMMTLGDYIRALNADHAGGISDGIHNLVNLHVAWEHNQRKEAGLPVIEHALAQSMKPDSQGKDGLEPSL